MKAQEILTTLKLDKKEFSKGFSDVQKDIIKVSAAFAAVSAAALASAKVTANYQDATIKLSRQAGVTSEAFTKLKLSADMGGVSTELLAKSLAKLSNPSASAKTALTTLGVSITKNNGQARASEEIFSDMADKIKNIESPSAKAAFAIEVFGAKGAALVNILKDGSEGIDMLSKKAEEMGLVVSQAAGEAAEKFNDDIAILDKTMEGLNYQIGQQVIAFVNETGVIQGIAGVVQGLISSYNNLDDTTKTIIKSALLAAAAIGAMATVILGAAGLKLAITQLIPLLTQMGLTATTAGGKVALAFGPLGAAFIGVTLLIATITKLQNKLNEIKGAELNVATQNMKNDLAKINKTELPGIVAQLKAASQAQNQTGANASTWNTILRQIADRHKDVAFLQGINTSNAGEFLKQIEATNKALKEQAEITNDPIPTGGGGSKPKVEVEVDIDYEKLRDMAVSSVEKTTDTIKKTWDNSFKNGEKLTLGEQVTDISKGFGDITSQALAMADTVMNVMVQQAQITVTKIKQQQEAASFFFSLYQQQLTKQLQQELDDLQRQEDEKIRILESAKNERLLLLDTEYQEAKRLREEEFQNFLESERLKYEANVALQQQQLTDEAIQAENKLANKEDWDAYVELLEQNHDDNLIKLQEDYNGRRGTTEKDGQAAIEAAKSAAEAIREKKEKEKKEKEKEASKAAALTKWTYEVAIAKATQTVQAQQTMLQAVGSAAQVFALMVGTLGPIGAVIGAGLGAQIIAVGSKAAAQIASAPPPAPPVELFAAKGGVFEGPSHAQGGITNVTMEGGEGVLSKDRTDSLNSVADSIISMAKNDGMQGGIIINIYASPGMDEEKLADAVARKFADRARSNMSRSY